LEKRCISEEVGSIRIPDLNEIREYVLKVYQDRISVPKGLKRKYVVIYLSKIDRVNSYLVNRVLNNLGKLSKISISKFYQEILKLAGINRYEQTLNILYRRMKVINRLWRVYRVRIKSSLDAKEARRVFREYIGRVLSIFRRSSDELDLIRSAVVLLSKIPCIDDLPTIVVAGMPQTGKSTFVGNVFTAKPKVSPFPFTTKDIILGHIELDGVKVQIIDTPGILDRPLNELNPIERKAYLAIKYLADYILYFIDPLEDSYYNIENQLKLLQSIINEFGEEKIFVVINKIDSVRPERLEYVKKLVSERTNTYIYTISALKNLNTHNLIRDVISRVRKNTV
jgi:nucleolar GTP-binding protein